MGRSSRTKASSRQQSKKKRGSLEVLGVIELRNGTALVFALERFGRREASTNPDEPATTLTVDENRRGPRLQAGAPQTNHSALPGEGGPFDGNGSN